MTPDAIVAIPLGVGAGVAAQAGLAIACGLPVHPVAGSAPELSRGFHAAAAGGERLGMRVDAGAAARTGAEDGDELRQIGAGSIVIDGAAGLCQADIAGEMALLADRI